MFQQESNRLDPPAEPRRCHAPVRQVVKVVGIHGAAALSSSILPSENSIQLCLDLSLVRFCCVGEVTGFPLWPLWCFVINKSTHSHFQ